MRIVSLVPHATELLFAIGVGDDVVAVTHECDYPPEAQDLAQVTRDVLPAGLSSAEIDAAVRERTQAGEAIYALDEDVLRAVEPDLIVTQALCAVCAVSFDDVEAVAKRLPTKPKVVSLDPKTYGETIGDVKTLAAATGAKEGALVHVAQAARRVDAVRAAVADAPIVKVAALEWLDPLFVAGHWTPQLIEMAGGEDVAGLPGEHSEQVPWELVAAAEPEVVVVMPCGFGVDRAEREALEHADELRSLGAERIVAVDGGAYFSRPGPRLVDGAELLAHILHPVLWPQPPAEVRDVDLTAARA